ncbi:MAG: hypothetical protein L0K96_00350 [Corynebacterium flavescens]|nr:hypothetical protein [Corynebacterium flavescens]
MVLTQARKVRRRGRATIREVDAMVLLSILRRNVTTGPAAHCITTLNISADTSRRDVVGRDGTLCRIHVTHGTSTRSQPFSYLGRHPAQLLDEAWRVRTIRLINIERDLSLRNRFPAKQRYRCSRPSDVVALSKKSDIGVDDGRSF